jgi:hypothetical protein
MPRLVLFPLSKKPIVANDNSLPAEVPRLPADVSRVALLAEPISSGPPGATTLKLALGLDVPIPTLRLACSQRLAPARTVLSTSMPKPMAELVQPLPAAVRDARMPRLVLFPLSKKPIVANDNSLPAEVPRLPADVSRVALLAEPTSSGPPGATTLKLALGLAVPIPTSPVVGNTF